jgi:hypothetical protein
MKASTLMTTRVRKNKNEFQNPNHQVGNNRDPTQLQAQVRKMRRKRQEPKRNADRDLEQGKGKVLEGGHRYFKKYSLLF